MLQETATITSWGKLYEFVYLGVAAVLTLPATSIASVPSGAMLETWQNRLRNLGERDDLAGVAQVVCRAHYDALALQLDFLSDDENDGEVEDFAQRRHWFRAIRERLAERDAGQLATDCRDIEIGRVLELRPEGNDILEQAAAILLEGVRTEFGVPPSLIPALYQLDQASLGILDAFALFLAAQLKDNDWFREA